MMRGLGGASDSTPEVQALFNDWACEMEQEALKFIRARGKAGPDEVASYLRVSPASAIFFISRLAREGKVRLGKVEAAI